MSSNKDCVSFTIPFHNNCPHYVQYTKNIHQIELETHTNIELLQIVRISGNIKNIKQADQRVSQLNENFAQIEIQDGLKNEVHILKSKFEEMENSYEQKIKGLTNALTNVKLENEAINTKAQENVQNEDLKCKIFQSEMQEMNNKFEQKIQELTNALTNVKLEMKAINTKTQENVQNEGFKCKEVFQSEISNVQSEIQEMKNIFEQKILELTNAMTNNKLEVTNTNVQETIENEHVISDEELKNFYKSEKYVNCIKWLGKQPLHAACELGRLDVVKKLIENGMDVNIKNNVNSTPLIYASCNGHKAIVEYLISKNADLNIRSKYYNLTALSIARNNKHYEIIKILENHGATA